MPTGLHIFQVDTRNPRGRTDAEAVLKLSVEALKGQTTILVIAHRLSTVRQADRILVFAEGELIASGTHAELVKDSELYARFADIQFSS